jgi:hypothetical protein
VSLRLAPGERGIVLLVDRAELEGETLELDSHELLVGRPHDAPGVLDLLRRSHPLTLREDSLVWVEDGPDLVLAGLTSAVAEVFQIVATIGRSAPR